MYGEFLGSVERTFHVGYESEVQFEVNKEDYVFKCLEAVSQSDKVTSRADCVEFKEISKDDKKGIYKYSVKLLKDSKDVLIRPVCVALPKILSVTPANNEIAYASTSIIVNFNMSMEAADTKPADTKFVYGDQNISLFYGLIDVSSYFEDPVFLNSQKDILVITPKTEEFFKYINKMSPIINVTVSFGSSIVNEEGLALAQTKTTSTVRYQAVKEEDAPVKLDFFATRHEISLAEQTSINSLSDDDKFNYDNIIYNQWGELDSTGNASLLQNRTNGTIYIYGKYYDGDSGVKGVWIKEKLVNDPVLKMEVQAPDFKTFYAAGSIGFEIKKDNNGNAEFCLCHKLKSGDGGVSVEVIVEDVAGNKSAVQSFSVAKKSSIHIDGEGVYLTNKKAVVYSNDYSYPDSLKKLILLIDYNYNPSYYNYSYTALHNVYPANCFSEEIYKNYKVNCEYINKAGTKKDIHLSYKGYWKDGDGIYDLKYGHYWEFDEDIEQVAGESLKIKITDDIGNYVEKQIVLPDSNKITYFKSDSNTIEFIYKKNGVSLIGGKLIKITDDETEIVTSFETNQVIIEDGFTYKIVPYIRDEDFNRVYVEMPDFTFSTQASGQPLTATVQLKNFEGTDVPYKIEKLENELLLFTISIDEAVWNDFDTVYLIAKAYNNDNSSYNQQITIPFTYGSTTASFKVHTRDFYSSGDYTFNLYGIKNMQTSNATSYTIPDPKGNPEYDNVKPWAITIGYGETIDETPCDYEHFRVYVNKLDEQSGAGRVVVKTRVLNRIYEVTDNQEYLYVPIRILQSDSYRNGYYFNFDFEVYDKAGNVTIGERNSGFRLFPATKKIQKNLTTWSLETETTTLPFSPGIKDFWCMDVYSWDEEHSSWSEDKTTITVGKLSEDDTQAYDIQNSDSIFTKTEIEDESGKLTGCYYTLSNVNLPQNKIIKILNYQKYKKNNGDLRTEWFSLPSYFYTGSPSSGTYDYIQPLNKKAVLITSDAPVFAQTLVTSCPYEECVNWEAEEWEFFKEHLGDAYFDFSSNSTAQKYVIPYDKIYEGDCYVVIAYFANGTKEISQVMQK